MSNTKNKIFLLEREPEDVEWDEYDSQVIIAENEEQARQLCHYDLEGRSVWLEDATIKIIGFPTGEYNEPQTILASYNSG